MNNHTERTTKPLLGTEPRQGAPAANAPERTPVTTPGRTPEAAGSVDPGNRKGLDRKLGGADDAGVPPAPRTAPTATHAERPGRREATGTGSPWSPGVTRTSCRSACSTR